VLWNTNAPVQGKLQKQPSSSKLKIKVKLLKFKVPIKRSCYKGDADEIQKPYHLPFKRFGMQELVQHQFIIWGSLLANKLISQGFLESHLQAPFSKFYGHYNNLVCPYNFPLGHMLSDMFHTNCWAVDTLILNTVHTVFLIWLLGLSWIRNFSNRFDSYKNLDFRIISIRLLDINYFHKLNIKLTISNASKYMKIFNFSTFIGIQRKVQFWFFLWGNKTI
jgi:hypothetical protein